MSLGGDKSLRRHAGPGTRPGTRPGLWDNPFSQLTALSRTFNVMIDGSDLISTDKHEGTRNQENKREQNGLEHVEHVKLVSCTH